MTKAGPANSLRHPLLKAGQIWQMAEVNLEVESVGQMLVHYKLGKPNALRISKSCSSIKAVTDYLKTHKAVLV